MGDALVFCIDRHFHGRKLLENNILPSPEIESERPHGNSAAHFDSNLVIILAALLCAVICACALNSILRCALRCRRGPEFESPEALAPIQRARKKLLRKIPVLVYGVPGSKPVAECPICLAGFVEGEKIRALPNCNHEFHVCCIDTWLLSNSSCPTCRSTLVESTSENKHQVVLRGQRSASCQRQNVDEVENSIGESSSGY